MKTQTLIELLARGAGPAPRALAPRRLATALAIGLPLGLAAALGLMGPIPAALWTDAGPWWKLAYGGALAAAALVWTARLGRPGAPDRAPARAVAAVVAAVVLLGALALAATPAGERVAALLGHSWAVCPINVLGLSLPTLAAALWALRGLAPTDARRAGCAAGTLAGAVGALAYTVACDEVALAFVAVWYTLGIVLAAGLGAALGPRLLRW
jgi:hypothetical protein